MNASDIGRLMMFAGGALLVLGVLFWLGGRLPWFGNLPGDIVVERDNFTLYAPQDARTQADKIPPGQFQNSVIP